jgi:hypothetical protein
MPDGPNRTVMPTPFSKRKTGTQLFGIDLPGNTTSRQRGVPMNLLPLDDEPIARHICRNRCRKLRLTGSASLRLFRWISAVSLSSRRTWLMARRLTTTERWTCAN